MLNNKNYFYYKKRRFIKFLTKIGVAYCKFLLKKWLYRNFITIQLAIATQEFLFKIFLL